MATPQASPLRAILRFGTFALDLRSGDLTKNRQSLRLQEKPRSLLLALAKRPGEIVTRAELHAQLWSGDTFVDFESNLNAAMSKLRETLGDDPQAPRFIETVRGRGYRLIVSARKGEVFVLPAMENTIPAVDDVPPQVAFPQPPDGVQDVVPPKHGILLTIWLRYGAAIATLLLAGAALAWWQLPMREPRVIRISQVTTQSNIDYLVKPVNDGSRVFFLERAGGHWNPMSTSIGGGEPEPFPGLSSNTRIMDISPDRTKFLIGRFTSRSSESSLWTMPVQGGEPVRLGDINSGEALWHSDGRRIVYVKRHELRVVDENGTSDKLFATLPDSADWLAWSPDGKRLRFTAGDPYGKVAIWEIGDDGTNLHQISLGGAQADSQCCGEWTPDGHYFIYSAKARGTSNLWAEREPRFSFRRASRGPFQLTDWPGGARGAHVTSDGTSVLFYGGRLRTQIMSIDIETGKTLAMTPEGYAEPNFSRDGRSLAFVDINNSALWKKSIDSSQMQRLSPEGFAVVFPKWSPDGRFIAASTITEGEPTNVYLIPTAGGAPLKLLPGEINVRDPDWSPDGKTIVVVHAPAGGEDALFLVDFATRTESPLPQSRGKFLPHWSPDGRHIAAYSADGQGVEVYDFATSAWQSVASGKGLGFPSWSQDGRFLYYQRLLDQDEPVYRVDLESHTTTRVVDFKAELGSGIWRCALMGLSPDGKLLVEFNRGFNDLYRAELSLPK